MKPPGTKDVAFVEPHVVVEVSYSEVTKAGTLRQPVLTAVRPDVSAHTVLLGENLAHMARRNEPSSSAHDRRCDATLPQSLRR